MGVEWYLGPMSAPVLEPRSYSLTVGDKGRLVIPAELRAAHGWEAGTAVIAVDDFLAGRRAEKAAEEKEVVGWGASSSTPRP